MRAADLELRIGRYDPGPSGGITDVAGVRVGHVTLVHGDGRLEVGRGPVRTGVTVVLPHDGDVWREPVFAGCHRLNGNGELTGLEWVRESGLLGGAVGLTNTNSVGVVRDALVAAAMEGVHPDQPSWLLPVVGETYDGALNDINGFHVRPEHVRQALGAADQGPVAEGNVGAGTGTVCFGFKGGMGTASRVLPGQSGGWTVGVLVQANFGRREHLRVDGVPVGREIGREEVPSPWDQVEARGRHAEGGGSVIVVVATDAPLLPHQCERLAQRPALGLGRIGSYGGHHSGDLIVAFATGNRGVSSAAGEEDPRLTAQVQMVVDGAIDPLFEAAVDATEEAVLNALLSADTMIGRDGVTAHRLDPDRLRAILDHRA